MIHYRTAGTATLDTPAVAAPAATATILTGTAVPYLQRAVIGGLFEEQFLPGALDATTIAPGASPTPLLLFHRHDDWPVGKSINWQSDQTALVGTWRLTAPATPYAPGTWHAAATSHA